MTSDQAGHDLLLGVLALQNGLLTRDQLVLSVEKWLMDKSQRLPDVMRHKGWIDNSGIDLVEELARTHSRYGGADCEQMIYSLLSSDAELQELSDLILVEGDPDEESIRSQLQAMRAEPTDEGGAVEFGTLREMPTNLPEANSDPENTFGDLPTSPGQASASSGSSESPATTTEENTLAPQTMPPAPSSGEDVTRVRDEPPVVRGRFRILRTLDKGGMGQVSVAWDTELNREVALKELQGQYARDKDLIERFQTEGEITGRLEHPGVVPVYGRDAPKDSAGYYAMRLVRGEDLQSRVQEFHSKYGGQLVNGEGRIDFMRLLRQFVDVCLAMDYAHSRGVIHRDIKPANIMIGKYGETFVVDWGLGKAVDEHEDYPTEGKISPQSLSGSRTHVTQIGATMGTPPFMPPEQAEGRTKDVGPASDIYSLGATLCYVLTNKRPVSGENTLEIVSRVSKGEIDHPTTVNKHVPKALEAICLKAMALKTADRYQTAGELADDLEKWMADEPVSVVQDSWVDRGRRWFRHHRGLAVTGMVSLVVVASITTVSSVVIDQSRRAEAEQRRTAENEKQRADEQAERNLRLAESEREAKEIAESRRKEALANFKQARSAVDTALTGISEILEYYPGVQRARLGLLEKVADDYLKFAAQQSDDVEIQIESGRAFLRLGEVRLALNQLERAGAAYRDGEKRFREILQRHPENVSAPLELATCLTKLAILSEIQGDTDNAKELYDKVILDLRNRLQGAGQQDRVREGLAFALSNRSTLELFIGEVRQAEAAALKALSLYEGLREGKPEEKSYTVGVAQLLNILGGIKSQTGRTREAAKDYEAGVGLIKSLLEKEPGYPPYLQSRATLSISLAISMRKDGDVAGELAAYDVAIGDYQRLCEALPDIPEFLENLALTQTDVGQVLQKTGDSRRAVEFLDRAIVVFDRLYQQHADVPRYVEDLATCAGVLGRAHASLGNQKEAEQFLRVASDLFEELVQLNSAVGRYAHRLAICRSHGAEVAGANDQQVKAIEQLNQAIGMMTELVAQHPTITAYGDTLAEIIATKSTFLAETEKPELSSVARKKCIAQWGKVIEQEDAPAYKANLARFLLKNPRQLNDEEGRRSLLLTSSCVQSTPLNAEYYNLFALACMLTNAPKKAEEALAQSRKLRRKPHGQDDAAEALMLALAGKPFEGGKALDKARQWAHDNQPGNRQLASFIEYVNLYLSPNK